VQLQLNPVFKLYTVLGFPDSQRFTGEEFVIVLLSVPQDPKETSLGSDPKTKDPTKVYVLFVT
jgi:hypothetical protein